MNTTGNLDITNTFNYIKENEFLYKYVDDLGLTFFVKLEKEVSKRFLNVQTGFYLNDMENYDLDSPELEINNSKRANTLAKIFVIEILPYIKSKRMSLQLNTLCDIRRRFINIFLTKFLTNDFTFTSRDDVFLIRRK